MYFTVTVNSVTTHFYVIKLRLAEHVRLRPGLPRELTAHPTPPSWIKGEEKRRKKVEVEKESERCGRLNSIARSCVCFSASKNLQMTINRFVTLLIFEIRMFSTFEYNHYQNYCH